MASEQFNQPQHGTVPAGQYYVPQPGLPPAGQVIAQQTPVYPWTDPSHAQIPGSTMPQMIAPAAQQLAICRVEVTMAEPTAVVTVAGSRGPKCRVIATGQQRMRGLQQSGMQPMHVGTQPALPGRQQVKPGEAAKSEWTKQMKGVAQATERTLMHVRLPVKEGQPPERKSKRLWPRVRKHRAEYYTIIFQSKRIERLFKHGLEQEEKEKAEASSMRLGALSLDDAPPHIEKLPDKVLIPILQLIGLLPNKKPNLSLYNMFRMKLVSKRFYGLIENNADKLPHYKIKGIRIRVCFLGYLHSVFKKCGKTSLMKMQREPSRMRLYFHTNESSDWC
ncbi:unnamed protein product [Gongylonema pulchrum]|uniref:F-box domain-containing protein n=1 Tax=Gongylonema pulchrum TaxID=637853 RepID=A0A183E4S0_9BILA|nr:unnamed protein product [Gongylonema pulchrum]